MIFKSKLPDIEVPSIGIYQYVTDNPNNVPDSKVILTDGVTGKEITFGEFKRDTKRLAAGLHDKVGFRRGDVAAIVSPNQVDYSVVLFGAIAAGGKVSPVNHSFTINELSFQLSDSGACIIISHPLVLPVVVKAATEAQISHSKIFLFGDKELDGFQPYSALFVDREFEPVEYTADESKNTTAFLCYSSGTIGNSKGVETTHTNMVANISQIVSLEMELGPKNVFISVLPYYHIYGLALLLNFILVLGASMVIIPKFELETFCRVVQDYKVDYAYLVPPMVLSLVKNPTVKKYDLSSLRMIVSGAAPLSKLLAEDLYKVHKVLVKQAYGLTEASPVVSFTEDKNIVIGSSGVLVPNIEVKIVSEDGQELGYNEPGELCVRGPNVMKGYLNNKKATDVAFDEDGFLHTGDIFIIDKQGNLYIVDRLKELIKYMSSQVAPTELEEILISHSAVADVAVVGVNCESEATEYILAYVKLKIGYKQSQNLTEEIKEYVADQVAPHKRLRDVLYIDQIPKSATGKILRRVLRKKSKAEYRISSKISYL